MKKYNLINPGKLSLSSHSEVNEKWVQDVITSNRVFKGWLNLLSEGRSTSVLS
jgi:hypothetical protein